jgi:monoamine oxidase
MSCLDPMDRDRIGGRTWTQGLSDGSAVDRGGAWLVPRRDAIFGLAREVGVSTYMTWVDDPIRGIVSWSAATRGGRRTTS